MRGADHFTESLFIMRKLKDYVPADHPQRPIRAMVNEALARLDPLFQQMYADDVLGGRPSIAPEKLLRAMLLQVFHSVRSERMLMEQVQYNMLYRWFVGLPMDAEVWVPTVFSKHRERLIKHDAVVAFFNEVLAIAERNRWLSEEHFSVDGTLIQAWAGHKRASFARMATMMMAAIFVGHHAAMRHTHRRRTRMLVCIARERPPASCATWAIF